MAPPPLPPSLATLWADPDLEGWLSLRAAGGSLEEAGTGRQAWWSCFGCGRKSHRHRRRRPVWARLAGDVLFWFEGPEPGAALLGAAPLAGATVTASGGGSSGGGKVVVAGVRGGGDFRGSVSSCWFKFGDAFGGLPSVVLEAACAQTRTDESSAKF